MNKMSVRGSGSRLLVCALRKTTADRKRAESRKLHPAVALGGGGQRRWRYRSERTWYRSLFDKTGHKRKRTCNIRGFALIQFPWVYKGCTNYPELTIHHLLFINHARNWYFSQTSLFVPFEVNITIKSKYSGSCILNKLTTGQNLNCYSR